MLPKRVFVLLVIYLAFSHTNSVQINYLKVPIAVKNDSKSPVIMDCNYSLRPDDTDLVVKWYLNDDLVYQWIPPQSPQSFGQLKDKVDLSYTATDDPRSVYRAMKIINPLTDLAGEYKCYVSTFTDEDFSVKSLKVFVAEQELDVLRNGYDETIVNFSCLASEVFPSPKLLVYKTYEDEHYRTRIPTVQWDISRHTSGRYSLYIVASAVREMLKPGSIIRCELRIPGTGYVKLKSLLYFPEGYIREDSSNGRARVISISECSNAVQGCGLDGDDLRTTSFRDLFSSDRARNRTLKGRKKGPTMEFPKIPAHTFNFWGCCVYVSWKKQIWQKTLENHYIHSVT